LLQTDNHANTSPLSFLQAGCPSCHPTNSVKALKDKALKEPNPPKTEKSQPNPTQSNPWVNPTLGQLCSGGTRLNTDL